MGCCVANEKFKKPQIQKVNLPQRARDQKKGGGNFSFTIIGFSQA